jgi:DNA-binding winged helix-turn-helix (wHTH) protein/Tol biopolymer transport system component
MTERRSFVFKFADVEVREREFLLIKAGERISVEPKAFRVLLYLLQSPGRLIPKDEIVGSVWSDSAVSDNSLTRSIAQLRRVLGDDSREPLYILTVPTVGYRFLCAVSAAEDGFGVSSESPRPGVSEVHENGLGDPAAVPSDLAPDLEEKPRGAPSKESAPSRPMIFIGLAVALLALVAGFLIRGAMKRKPVSGGNAISYPLVEQRVTSNPPDDPIEGAVISPDGKYVAYADPTGLYLRLMSTGETRPWILPKGFVARPNSWFPDSTHLLVVRIEGQTQGFDLDLWKPSLYKLSLLGGEPQKIMENAAAGCVSPDGARIAYLTRANVAKELWVMDSDGSNGRRVVSAGVLDKSGLYGSWLFPPVWSPGGQRLAYIEIHGINGSAPHEPSASVMTIDPNSGAPREAVNGSRVGQALWWANDGRILFAYHQDPSSKKIDDGVYSIRIDDRTGKAVGPPQPITQAEGFISGLSATADGKRLVLWRTREPLGAFIAKFDARTRQFGEPRRMTLDENENIASAWTADSRAILFASNRNGTWKLFKQGIDETTPEALTEAPIIGLSRLSPDGSQVLYLSSSTPDDDSVPAFLMGKPLAGGPPHLVRQVKGINNFGCARAPSKVCIFSKLVGQDHVFVSFDPNYDGGRELPIKMNGLMNWVISPDGSKLAIVLDRHRIRFFTVDTGVANDVTVKDWPIDNMDWSADGKTFFMPSVTPKDVPVILEVDQTGKARVVLQGFANTRIDWMIPSPDGKYGLLLEDTQAENNAWMVDNF